MVSDGPSSRGFAFRYVIDFWRGPPWTHISNPPGGISFSLPLVNLVKGWPGGFFAWVSKMSFARFPVLGLWGC